MNVPYRWLKEYTNVNVEPKKFSHEMNMTGTETTGFTCVADTIKKDAFSAIEKLKKAGIRTCLHIINGLPGEDRDMMLEECGDVLLQAVFHTQIAEDEKDFTWTDMITGICRKLLDRHTHIFGENHADTPEEALMYWAEAKKKEKKYTSNTDAMGRVPKNFPALLYAEKVQKIAKKCGFDWDTVDGAVDKVKEELDELLTAKPEDRHEEAGDLLFAVCNVLRFFKVDNEMALHDASRKFVRRFEVVEQMATKDGKSMTDFTLPELDEFWNEAKRQGK